MDISFSLIIPVYNRPDEVDELLESLTKQQYKKPYEIVIIEDGSSVPSDKIIENYRDRLNISYYFIPNGGPGNARNYGMTIAKGNYFIILDSDCLLPEHYLEEAEKALEADYVDCFGGPDAAHASFTAIQKAINFAMTSFLTTGGIRGKNEAIGKFQPRSFNMGLSKKAFLVSAGFGRVHPGEDPDLSIRLWKLGFETRLFPKVFVYHKRRISWSKFYIQVNKFGKVRNILNAWHPEHKKLTYWFPALFIVGLFVSLLLVMIGIPQLFRLYVFYFILVFIASLVSEKNLKIAFLSLLAVFIQLYGYGKGFLEGWYRIVLRRKKPEEAFPNLFF